MATRTNTEHGSHLDSAQDEEENPDSADILRSVTGKIDFHDPQAVRQFITSLLKKDFDLTIQLPEDRLCPPPSRYFYVQWIQDLVESTSPSYYENFNLAQPEYQGESEEKRQVWGLDIGTGASCIYTLLALRKRPEWNMAATDIDPFSFSHAIKNIEVNGFSSRSRLLQTRPSDPLIPLDALQLEKLDFTICNPPFFTSVEEWKASISGKGKTKPPNSVCTGAETEMVTKGGDLGFVLRMLEESLVLKEKVQWYTSMLGKLSSTRKVVEKLKEVGCKNWAVCCLGAQHKTRRWVVGWSWCDIRPRADVARRDMNVKDILPFPSDSAIPVQGETAEAVSGIINNTLTSLDLEWIWNESIQTGIGRAKQNVWSRSARRKRKREEVETQSTGQMTTVNVDDQIDNIALGFKVSVRPDAVMVRWLQGSDQVLYESFCGMLKRTLRTLSGMKDGN